VFWHLDRVDGGSIKVSGKGYWGDIVLAPNDLLFLHAEIQYPGSHTSVPAAAVAAVQYVEVSNAELLHRRLGHPGRLATKQLVSLEKVPAGAAAPRCLPIAAPVSWARQPKCLGLLLSVLRLAA